MARRSRAPFRVSVAAATPAALADAAVSAAAGPEGMYITGSRAGAPAPGGSGEAASQGGRAACAVPPGSSAARLSTQPSCSQGGRSNVWVLAGAGPLLAVAVASVV